MARSPSSTQGVRHGPAPFQRRAERYSEDGVPYLLWKHGEGRKDPAWAGSFLANGHFGQFILCLPALDMVIVHRCAIPDDLAIAPNIGTTKASIPGVKVDQFLRIADQIVASAG